MKSIGIVLFAAALLLALSSSTLAAGTAGRTFVSGHGVDTNPCSLPLPCRTFTAALAQTAPGGEVVVLDSAGYGPFSISQAVTIQAPQGVYAGISTSGDGISIAVGAADAVILRGLTLSNQGGAGSGIVFSAGGALHVEDCVVNGFSEADGIDSLSSGTLYVDDTTVRKSSIGIEIKGGGKASIERCRLDDNSGDGLSVTSGAGAIRNSTLNGNQAGIVVVALSGAAALLDIDSCLITNNGFGVFVEATHGTSAISISNCTITHDSTAGFTAQDGGTIFSRGNNTFIGNGANVGSLTPLTPQ